MYKEELQTKPALLAVNKMDLPDAQDKFQVLMNQLQSPKGKSIHVFSADLMDTYRLQRMLGSSRLQRMLGSSRWKSKQSRSSLKKVSLKKEQMQSDTVK